MIGVDTSVVVQLEIIEIPGHRRAHELLRSEVLDRGEELALAPQVLTEFLHVVTDPRRFQRPLTMEQALLKARFWWQAREVRHLYPSAESTALFLIGSLSSAWVENDCSTRTWRPHSGRRACAGF